MWSGAGSLGGAFDILGVAWFWLVRLSDIALDPSPCFRVSFSLFCVFPSFFDLSPPRGFGRALPFPSPAGGLGSRLPVSSCCASGGVFLVGGSACFARAVCVGAAGRAGASHPSALSCAPSRKMQTADARTHVAPLFRGGGLAACMSAGSCGGVLVSPAGGVLFPPRLSFSQLERRAPFFVWVFHCGSLVGPGGVSLLL